MAKNEGLTETLSPLAQERCELIRSLLTEANRPKEGVSVFRNAIPAPFMTDRVGHGGRPITASKRLAEDPRPIGIATLSSKVFSNGHGAKMIAQAMFALDIVPSEYTCIICHPTENLVKDLPTKEELSRVGIDILYDTEGVFGNGSIDISRGAFSTDGRRFSVDYSKLGELSDSAKRIVRTKTVSACRSLVKQNPRYSSYSSGWSSSTYDSVPSTELVAETLSFGQWAFDEMDGWGDLADGETVADLAVMMEYSVPNDGHGYEAFDGLVYETPYNRFADLFQIWKTRFAEYGLDRDVLVNVISSGHAVKLGHQLLIDNDVDAYLSGVPAEDILA